MLTKESTPPTIVTGEQNCVKEADTGSFDKGYCRKGISGMGFVAVLNAT